MTVPPDRPADGTEPAARPVSMDKPGEPAELDFDPYRFGAPEHPIPPEYAPPGYKPPQAAQPAPPGLQPPAGYPPPAYQTGPPPPPQQAPYGMPYYVPQRRGTGKAVAALVLGIGSIVLSILSVFDIVLIALALIFGIIALTEANRSPQREGRGMAIAGIICAAVGAILAVVLTLWFVGAARHCTQYDGGSSQFQTCFRDHL